MKSKATLRKTITELKKKSSKSFQSFDQGLLGLGIKITQKGDK